MNGWMQKQCKKVRYMPKFQFCEKRIVSNPKGINRKKLVPFVLLINAQRGCKEKLNMTDKVKYES